MLSLALAAALLSSMSGAGIVQESQGDELGESSSLAVRPIDPDEFVLPRSLSSEIPAADETASFSMGPAGGYLKARGSDQGTWFGGAQARLHLAKFFAAEAALTFHQNRYEDGDVVVTQYPLQLTAFLYVLPQGPIRPYILGGVGWYYTRVDYRGTFDTLNNDRTEHIFGEHLGAGVELMLGPRVSVDLDFRYIFLNPTRDKVLDRDFNYGQITFGVNLFF